MFKKSVIIINPVAGKMKIKKELFDLIDSIERHGFEITVHITRARGDAASAACKYGMTHDLIVCCGGDGTLNEVISGLLKIDRKPLLMYFPCGSTNDFATTLGLPKNIDAANLCLKSKKIMNLDIGTLNGDLHFSYITSFGLFTKASFSADQKVKNMIGHLAYILEGAKELHDLGKTYHTRIHYDGGTIEGDYAFVAVTNSTSAGGILRLPSDMVKLNDGLFEILLIKGLTSAANVSNVISMLIQQKYDGDSITMIQTTKATIDCSPATEWCTDGEYAGKLSHAEIECIKGAVRILV